MELSKLLKNILADSTNDEIDVKGICIDSRKVTKGDLFICLKGNLDGHDYVDEAIENGSVCVVSEKQITDKVKNIVVDDTRIAYSIMSNNFFDNPNKKLKLIAIVGTNGKTSTSYIVRHILKSNGYKIGLIGTINNIINDKIYPSKLTTPDCFELNWLLSEMVKAGDEYVVMEVSAHAIFYKKLFGIVFDYTIFTNFSQDHLDFFKNLENYKNCKKSFFNESSTKMAIVNSDDLVGNEILQTSELTTVSYGLFNPSDVFAIDVTVFKDGTNFVCNAFDNVYDVSLPLHGIFNIYNSLSALTLARVIGIPLASIIKSLNCVPEIDGRFNVVDCFGTRVIIDYAHTEDGLKNLLETVKIGSRGKIITVFGCGGNRDKSKRKLMGKIASKFSNVLVLTSDNPRNEKPIDIINDILEGVDCDEVLKIENREVAIHKALNLAMKNDCVVIAGKGAEKYVEINGIFYPQNDKDIVESYIEEKQCNKK